jgi:hypothetical protein
MIIFVPIFDLLIMWQGFNDGTLGMKVSIKPGGRITVMFLQAPILSLIPTVRLVDARTPTWITTSLVRFWAWRFISHSLAY